MYGQFVITLYVENTILYLCYTFFPLKRIALTKFHDYVTHSVAIMQRQKRVRGVKEEDTGNPQVNFEHNLLLCMTCNLLLLYIDLYIPHYLLIWG